MKKDKMTERLLSVAMYYYMDQMTQAEIADKFGISRQAVGRLLDIAKDRGIVDIKIIEKLSYSMVYYEKI